MRPSRLFFLSGGVAFWISLLSSPPLALQSASALGVPLDAYREGKTAPAELVSDFRLVFEGKLDHVVEFRLGGSPALLVQCDLTFPNGESAHQERFVEASDGSRQVAFSLGPLLGHGPYLHRPRQFYPGEYTLRVVGRDPKTGVRQKCRGEGAISLFLL